MSETIMIQARKMRESLGHVKKVALRSRFGLPGLRLKVESQERTRTIRLDAFDGSSFASAWWTQGDSGPRVEWNYCLDPKTLDAVLGQIDGDALTIEAQTQTITETGKDGQPVERKQATAIIRDTNAPKKWRIALQDGANFQTMPKVGGWQKLPFGGDVKMAPVAVQHCAHKDAQKMANLIGVKIEFADGKFHAVATDTHRMAVWESADDSGFSGALILPPELCAIIGNGTYSELLMEPDGKLAALAERKPDEGRFVISPLFDAANYPDWRRVIPQSEPAVELEIDAAAMRGALDAVSVVITPVQMGVRITFDGRSALKLDVDGINRADAEVAVCEVLAGSGQEFAVTLNHAYIGEFVAVIAGTKNKHEKFKLEFRGDEKPVLLRDGEGYFDLIMPMKR